MKDELAKCERSKKSDLVQNFKEIDIEKLSPLQIENAHKFLATTSEEELTSYLLGSSLFDSTRPLGDKTKEFMLNYAELLAGIGDLTDKINKDSTIVKKDVGKKKVKS